MEQYMKVNLLVALLLTFVIACSSNKENNLANTTPSCSPQIYQLISDQVQTDDALGHGPDIATDEWKSTIEFTLGLRGESSTPSHTSDQWCGYILNIIETKSAEQSDANVIDNITTDISPSFDCTASQLGSVEDLICSHVDLALLDRRLSQVYQQAKYTLSANQISTLKAMQHGWRKGRNDCWKAEKQLRCVKQIYVDRIAELQANYQLVSSKGPFSFYCDDNASSKVNVTFYQTKPTTLIAKYNDTKSLMFQKPSASGAKYQGRNESFWQHQGQARIVWGFNAKPMICKLKQ